MDMTIENSDSELYEPEHIEEVFTALTDSLAPVSGTEQLTNAQQYMWSVLGASGALTRGEQVAGTEGFFSKIGEGIKKIWEYIQNMFKNIWNWFFGSNAEGDKTISKTKEVVKKNEEHLKVLTSSTPPPKEEIAVQIIKTTEDLDRYMNEGGNKSTGEALKAKLEEAKPLEPAEQVKIVEEVIEKFVKINTRAHRALDEQCKKALDEYKYYQELVTFDHADKFRNTAFSGMYRTYLAAMTHNASKPIDSFVKIPRDTRTLRDAERVQATLSYIIKDLESEMKSISSGIKSDCIAQIKRLEKLLNEKGMLLNQATEDKFHDDLQACRLLLSLTTQAIKQLRTTCENIRRVSKMVNRLFSVIAN